MQITQLLGLYEHFAKQEALPAEKMDQNVLSDTCHWDPLEKFPVETKRVNVRFDFISLFNQ